MTKRNYLANCVVSLFELFFEIGVLKLRVFEGGAQLDELVEQLVTLSDQVVACSHKLIDILLLADGEAGALLDQLSHVGDFKLETLDGLLGRLFLLQREIRHLPGLLQLLKCDTQKTQ